MNESPIDGIGCPADAHGFNATITGLARAYTRWAYAINAAGGASPLLQTVQFTVNN